MVPHPGLRAGVPRAHVVDKGRGVGVEGVRVLGSEEVEGHSLVLQGVEVVAPGAGEAVAGLCGCYIFLGVG